MPIFLWLVWNENYMQTINSTHFYGYGFYMFLTIFCIWTNRKKKFNEFFQYLNEFNPTIKFTVEKSFNKITFLDVTVSENNNKLSTDLYTKETDINQYIHASSCHRSSIKIAIPYIQAVLTPTRMKQFWKKD